MRCLYLYLIFATTCLAANVWRDQIEKYRHCINEPTYQLLLQQCSCCTEGKAPSISDAVIKSVPIVESHESLVSIASLAHPRIWVLAGERLLVAHDLPEDIDPRGPLHGYVRASVADALICMVAELDRLAPYFGYESGELEIAIFEGLRDLATQKELFDSKLAALMKADSSVTYEDAYRATSYWVSPYIDNVPTHSTGAAVDLCLWSNKTNTFCRMGRFNVGGITAPTFTKELLSDDEILNRLLCVCAATAAGLTNYVYEFWHFSYGDRYAAYWRCADAHQRCAQYGAL